MPCVIEELVSNKNVQRVTHSHNDDPSLNGLAQNSVSQEDLDWAKYINKIFPNKEITFRAYDARTG